MSQQEIETAWEEGFTKGWKEQSAIPNPPEPTIPACPPFNTPEEARTEGHKKGVLARVRVQAGI